MAEREFVFLESRRNRGYPWPEDSWGLEPMYGDHGWCGSCGVPLRDQVGPLTLQRRSGSTYRGAWVPNWQHDCLCVEEDLAGELAARFRVDLRPVAWRGRSGGNVQQVLATTSRRPWYPDEKLRRVAVANHGSDGARCDTCGTFRWFPIAAKDLPPPRRDGIWEHSDRVAGPEWFGDGWQAWRHVAVLRELADLVVEHSPRDFVVVPMGGSR